MNHAELKHVLEVGLGRIIVFLQQHDARPYHDLILDACIHNMAYDPQVEGTFEQYVFDIIQMTGEPMVFRDHLLANLPEDMEDDRDELHMVRLAKLFAQQGDAEARQAIYDKVAATARRQD
jgi:hypothetical protein